MSRCITPVCAILLGLTTSGAAEPGRTPFERVLSPGRTRPRPADGETVAANPPCFVYPATKQYDTYLLQYSRRRDFPSDGTFDLTVVAPGRLLVAHNTALNRR